MRLLALILLVWQQAAAKNTGCDAGDFSVMLVRSRAYYRSGLFELSDSERVSRILENREVMKDICPAALLQAILLKLEENLVYQADAFQSLMAQYTLYLHEALRNEKITSDDMMTWPLDEGVRRVKNISEALAEKRSLSSAMVMNYCQTVDRFGTSHELDWILEPPFGEDLGGETGLLTDTDFYIYQVDWPWCVPLREEVLSKVRKAVRHLQVIKYSAGPRREEQTAYFKYIADNWEQLPDYTIFVHPDANEHQGALFLALRRALRLIKTQSRFAEEALAYYPLAQQMVVEPKRVWGKDFVALWHRFWSRVFGHPWKDLGLEAPRCKWQKHAGYYLLGYADTGRRESLPAAKATCAQLDDECFGVTCLTPLEPEELDLDLSDVPSLLPRDRFGRNSCTARRGKEGLQESPEGREVSYVKSCESQGATDQTQHVAGATYRTVKDSFLFGYAAGDEIVRGELEARHRCDELLTCRGFTCERSIDVTTSMTKQGYAEAQKALKCTVRAGSELIESPTGELTFLKIPPSPQLKKAVSRARSKDDASGVFQFYTGSQSIVRKDRLQWWPLAEIESFAADGVWCCSTTGLFEAVWHRMFGEPLSQYSREADPALPLYLKWEIPTFFSFGDEEVI